METDRNKLLRLADALATSKGLTLVVQYYADGSGARLNFQPADSFETAFWILWGWNRESADKTYDRILHEMKSHETSTTPVESG